jgi:hypothetical protein
MAWAPALIAMAATATLAGPQPQGDVVRYVIQPGDTLYVLTRSFLVAPRTWHALLPLSGTRDPRRLAIGRTLLVPRAWLRATEDEARLASFRGTVTIALNGRAVAPVIGMALGEGTRIETAANSFVTLVFANRSRVTLPSLSRVVVRRMRHLVLNGALDYQVDLEQGRVGTTVTPLTDPSGRYRIGTPLTMTAVRGTEFRVTYDPVGPASATEVLAGTVAVSAPDGRAPTLVPYAHGATTDGQGRIATTTLLPAPELVDPGKVQHDDVVGLHVAPVAGAGGYWVTLASDAGFVDSYAEQYSPTGDFALKAVPDGNQFVRVSAVAGNGIEGMAQTYAFFRRLASIHGGAVSHDRDSYRFRWYGEGHGVRHYRLQILRGTTDGVPVVDEVGLVQQEAAVRRLPPGVYYWRVAVIQSDGNGDTEIWTEPEKLTIAAPTHGG